MNDSQKRELILDMVKKGLEDLGNVFKNIHQLTHIAGGDCRDASFAQMIITEIAWKAMDKGIGDYNRKELDDLFKRANEDFQKAVASQEAEINKLLEEERHRFFKEVLERVFDGELEVVEINKVDPVAPTRH